MCNEVDDTLYNWISGPLIDDREFSLAMMTEPARKTSLENKHFATVNILRLSNLVRILQS